MVSKLGSLDNTFLGVVVINKVYLVVVVFPVVVLCKVVVVLDVLESIFKMFLNIVTVDIVDQRPWYLVQLKVKVKISNVEVFSVSIVVKWDTLNVTVLSIRLICKVVNKMLVVVKNSCITW